MDPEQAYLELGRATRQALERLLPVDWSWTGKRVLDFGCGAGRALRHFLPEAGSAEFWGADIDRASIEWNCAHLTPPLHFTLNDETPPFALPDAKFDLIYAISVFSHLSDHWSAWLVELNRVLAPGGRIILTFMGEGMSQRIANKPWVEADVGMSVYLPGHTWENGGPMVLLSPWWIREHWGRLFEIESLLPRNFAGDQAIYGVHDHGVAVLKKTDRIVSIAELERPCPGELRTLDLELRRLRADAANLRHNLETTVVTGRQGLRAVATAIGKRLPFRRKQSAI